MPKFDKSNLHMIIWLQIFLSNSNHFQTDLFNPEMGPKQVLPLSSGSETYLAGRGVEGSYISARDAASIF